jgi:D-arabinose 1-dehydrogenase-like Zn-dependent alcohol dehydrogenase
MPKMRAIQIAKKGAPLELLERELPQPGRGEVRVKVQACGVCHSDTVAKEGLFPSIPYPIVPGHEIAGLVDAVGEGVVGWSVGTRVGVGWFGGHCGHCEPCRRGLLIDCRNLRIPGVTYKLVVVGAGMDPIQVRPLDQNFGSRTIVGHASGASIDSQDTLAFSALSGVRPTIEIMPLERAAEAFDKMMRNEARFRMVLTTGL